MSLESTKAELRKIFKAKRASASEAEIEFLSEKILENFSEFFTKNPQIFEKKIIGLYLENKGEVAVSKIANFLLQKSIQICFPKIIKPDEPLCFMAFEAGDQKFEEDFEEKFERSQFFKNIFEPKSGKIIQPDILLIPLLAFDSELSRLGMGSGFYDRSLSFLRKKNRNFLAIGLAFDWQFCEEGLPSEEFDEKMDLIFTPTRLLFCSEARIL